MRFHNLLADIAADVVVILSTHIVGDVADLCGQFAVIDKGRVRLTGDPSPLVAGLAGRIWQKVVAKAEAEALKREMAVVSTRLAAGRTVLRVHAAAAPAPGFDAVAPDLEDVYFCTIAGHLGAAAVAPATTAAAAAPAA